MNFSFLFPIPIFQTHPKREQKKKKTCKENLISENFRAKSHC